MDQRCHTFSFGHYHQAPGASCVILYILVLSLVHFMQSLYPLSFTCLYRDCYGPFALFLPYFGAMGKLKFTLTYTNTKVENMLKVNNIWKKNQEKYVKRV